MQTRQLTAMISLSLLATFVDAGSWSIDGETGAVDASRADVRIPSEGGTKFSLTDDLDSEASPYLRIGIGYAIDEFHSLRFEAVPLTLDSNGTFNTPVTFAGANFAADTPTDGSFRFDTYRLEYRYRMDDEGMFRWRIGATLLVRDAEITLTQGGIQASDDNLGIVPLLGFDMDWRLGEKWQAVIDGNALASSQGRAEDVFIGLRWAQTGKTDVQFGYRVLEGGSDGDDVYTFALFNHFALGIRHHF